MFVGVAERVFNGKPWEGGADWGFSAVAAEASDFSVEGVDFSLPPGSEDRLECFPLIGRV